MTIEYTPPPTVARMLHSRAYIRGIKGPLGSGKSVGCAMALVKNALEQTPDPKTGIRHSRHAVIRNTYRMLKDTTLKTVFEWLPPGVAGQWRESTMTYTLRFGDVQSEWLFRALDSPDDVRNLLSLELTSAWINEYREIDYNTLINLLGRLGRFPRKQPKIGFPGARFRGVVLDSNPPPFGSPWHDLFENDPDPAIEQALRKAMKNAPEDERNRPVIEYFQQPGGLDDEAENRDNLPEGYYELLIAANAHRGPEWTNVHVHAEYGQDPSNTPVYPDFDTRVHAGELAALPSSLTLMMDFGRSPALVVAQNTPEGWWNVLAELTSRNMDIEKFLSQKMLPFLSQRFPDRSFSDMVIYGDPAGNHKSQQSSRTCFEILRHKGFTVMPGESDPTIRVGTVRKCLTTLVNGRPILMVDSRHAPTLLKGFQYGYKFGHTREGELNPQPIKNEFSHPHDALQHGLGKLEAIALKTDKKARQFNKPVVRKAEWKVFG